MLPNQPNPQTAVDPFALVKKDLAPFSDNMKELVEAENPVLTAAAKHFFEKRHGKRFRPTIVMLMCTYACARVCASESVLLHSSLLLVRIPSRFAYLYLSHRTTTPP